MHGLLLLASSFGDQVTESAGDHITGIIIVIISATGTVLAARANGHAKAASDKAGTASTNTTPNGHGPLPKAVGDAIESISFLARDVQSLNAKVDEVIVWAARHDVKHEYDAAHLRAASDLRAEIAEQRAIVQDSQ